MAEKSNLAADLAIIPDAYRLSGKAWVTLTIHAERAFQNSGIFKELRGTSHFHKLIVGLEDYFPLEDTNSEVIRGSNDFCLDSGAEDLRSAGFRAGVFNQLPLDNEFVPVFRYFGSDGFLDERTSEADRLEPDCFSWNQAWDRAPSDLPFVPLQFLSDFHCRALDEKLGAGNSPKTSKLAEGLAELYAPFARRFREVWRSWDKWILMTRYGHFQIWLRRRFKDEQPSKIMTGTTRLQSLLPTPYRLAVSERERSELLQSENTEAKKVFHAVQELRIKTKPLDCYFQWEIARILIGKFISACRQRATESGWSERLVENFDREWYRDRDSPGKLNLPLCLRHTIYFVSSIKKKNEEDERLIEVKHLEERSATVVACLAEGVPVAEKFSTSDSDRNSHVGGQLSESLNSLREGAKYRPERYFDEQILSGVRIRAPPLSPSVIKSWVRENAASWQDELFLISSEITFLCSLQEDRLLMFHGPVRYSDYWKTIFRGLAHLCEMRLLSKELRAETGDLLEKTLDSNKAGHVLSQQSQILSMLLARLRSASDAAAIASGKYAVDKFRRISKVFNIPEVAEESQRNLELVNAALSQRESMALERTQVFLNVGVGIFAVATILLDLPQFYEASGLPSAREFLGSGSGSIL